MVAMSRSMGVSPCRTSSSRRMTSAWSIAMRVCASIAARDASFAPSRSSPAVSTTVNSRPRHSATPYRRSRVSPDWASTIAFFQPIRRLKRVDLPTFGRPTIATIGRATRQLDGFWLPHPQNHARARAQKRAEPERYRRADERPQRAGHHARGEVGYTVDPVEHTKRRAQPPWLDQRAGERALHRADYRVLGADQKRHQSKGQPAMADHADDACSCKDHVGGRQYRSLAHVVREPSRWKRDRRADRVVREIEADGRRQGGGLGQLRLHDLRRAPREDRRGEIADAEDPNGQHQAPESGGQRNTERDRVRPLSPRVTCDQGEENDAHRARDKRDPENGSEVVAAGQEEKRGRRADQSTCRGQRLVNTERLDAVFLLDRSGKHRRADRLPKAAPPPGP